MDIITSHKILGLSINSSIDEVKQIYRDLVFIWHPDRIPKNNERLKVIAEEKIKGINNAYDILCEYYRPKQIKENANPQTNHSPHQNGTSQINSAPSQLRSTPYYGARQHFQSIYNEWSNAYAAKTLPVYSWRRHYPGDPFSLADFLAMKIFNLNNQLRVLDYVQNKFVYKTNNPPSDFFPHIENSSSDFIYQANDTITDFSTGLMWSVANFKIKNNTKKFYNIIAHSTTECFAGYNNWRIPTIDELKSLLNPEPTLYIKCPYFPDIDHHYLYADLKVNVDSRLLSSDVYEYTKDLYDNDNYFLYGLNFTNDDQHVYGYTNRFYPSFKLVRTISEDEYIRTHI